MGSCFGCSVPPLMVARCICLTHLLWKDLPVNVDRTLRYLVVTVVAVFVALWLWASSMNGGGSPAGLLVWVITSIFCALAGPLCIFGAIVGVFSKDGVKLGLIFGLTSALGLTGLIMLRLLFWH